MRAMSTKLGATVALAAALTGMAAPASAELGTIRLDNWLFYQDNFGDTSRWQYRPRVFVPYSLAGGWTFTQRADLPLYYTDASGPENPSGGWKFGVSDALVEEIFDTPDVARNVRLRASLRIVFPTGGEAPFGSDQWQVAPGFGGTWRYPDLWGGTTFAPYARYFYGFSEGSSSVTTKRSWNLFPTATFTLVPNWSLVFWPEQGITYNIRSHLWFVPIEAMVTNRVDKQWEWSAGGAWSTNDNEKSYKWLFQSRLTYYFD
jgi:hypothetical protein